MNQGTAQYYLGRYQDAARTYQRALEGVQDDYLLYGNYADALVEFSDDNQRINELYNKAISLAVDLIIKGADDSYIALDLAHYHSQLGEYQQADDYFTQFNKQEPDSEYYYYFRAISYSRRGNIEQANNYLNSALAGGFPQQYIENTPILKSVIDQKYKDI